MHALKIVYFANVIVAGWIGITSLFFPEKAKAVIFNNDFAYSEAIRLVGALWCAIFLLSIAGLFYPTNMLLVLIFQLTYKSLWLLFAGLPAVVYKHPFPKAMAIFFIVWVIVLPFVIPWDVFFKNK